jgi:hypothetical protein
MTTQQTQFLSEVLEGKRIPEEKLAYFRARLKNRLHAFVLTQFLQLEKTKDFSKADLARRLGKKPEQITRWLGGPGNWTLDTLSDLLLGMGFEPNFFAANLKHGAIRPDQEAWRPSPEPQKSQSDTSGSVTDLMQWLKKTTPPQRIEPVPHGPQGNAEPPPRPETSSQTQAERKAMAAA